MHELENLGFILIANFVLSFYAYVPVFHLLARVFRLKKDIKCWTT